MTTDPKEFPGADPHTGSRDIDPVTGYDTTGHEWGGIKELNPPFPRFVLWFLVATVVYSVIAWVLLPAWPYGPDYTRGLLGLDQREMAAEGVQSVADIRAEWLSRFDDPDYTALQDDGALMARAMPAADRLYNDNCAVCHGDEGGTSDTWADSHGRIFAVCRRMLSHHVGTQSPVEWSGFPLDQAFR